MFPQIQLELRLIVSKRVVRSSPVIMCPIFDGPNIEVETERFNESFELQHYIAKKRINER